MNGEFLSKRQEYEDEGAKNQQNLLMRRSLNLGRTSGQVVWNELSPINTNGCGRECLSRFCPASDKLLGFLFPKVSLVK